MAQVYDDSSIDQLLGADRIRKRPASMLGSSGLAGARHGFTEIYGNALDERSAGYGDRLDVHYYEDGSVSLRDYGRGVPLGWNAKPTVKNWNWHVIYNELYGGGKYDNGQWYLQSIDKESEWNILDSMVRIPLYSEFGIIPEDLPDDNVAYQYKDISIRRNGDTLYLKVLNVSWSNVTMALLNERLNYITSVGLNGLGAASTQYTSEFFEVRSYRDGKCTSRSFKRGIPLVNGEPYDMFSATQEEIEAIPEEITDTDEANGTFIRWKPDNTVFDDVNIGSDWLYNTCKDIAGVAGIDLHFVDDIAGVDKYIKSEDLQATVLNYAGKDIVLDDDGTPVLFNAKSFDHGITKVEGKNFVWVCDCEVEFGFTKRAVPSVCFHNSVRMITGVQYEAVQDAITAFLMERGRAVNIKVDKRDFDGTFAVVVSTYSNYASFRNQTKDAVDDPFIYTIVKETLLTKLQVEYGKGNPAVKRLVDRVLEEATVRMQTAELATIARQTAKIKREKAPQKFISCDAYEEKRWDEVELWITEGDSAAGSVKDARNKNFQAIFPIRGKGLNVAKAGIKKVLKNKEIREIFAILGTGFDLNIKGEKFFNLDDLKVGKIIIATDADEDGYQIRVLLFLTFYMLAPQLLTSGRVFIAETPRFGIDLTDGTRIYAKNDVERDEIIKEYNGRIKHIGRYKGLGEVDAEILRETTVHPNTRMLIPVTCDMQNNVERDLIDALFGADKFKQRKSIISAVLGSDISSMIDDNALLVGSIDEEEIEDDTEYTEVVV